jgi:hypothetical protein
MKNALRIAALGLIVSAAMLSTAHAGSCSVRCNNGLVWNGSTPDVASCCTKIVTVCGNLGEVRYNGIKCDPGYWTE